LTFGERVGELMGHEGCGGEGKLVEFITGIPAASKLVRRIILVDRTLALTLPT
jgi:hypothetical protein